MTLFSALEKEQGTLQGRLNELDHYVGRTPFHKIQNLCNNPNVTILAKMEWLQLGGSVKARPAFQIIKEAVKKGHLANGKTLLDATSGNTGIAYGIFCALSHIPLTLCVPANASKERKHMLSSLKVNVVYTSPFETTDGAQAVAREMADANPGQYYYADQYSNEANWRAHYLTTAPEIWEHTEGRITHFVCGLGTTGTFTGTGTRLKELNPAVKLIALQPDNPLHGLEGWKHLETAKVPAIYNSSLADEFMPVGTLEAYEMMKDALKHEGLSLSPSAAANLAGALRLADSIDSGIIVTVLPDNSVKYSEVANQLFN